MPFVVSEFIRVDGLSFADKKIVLDEPVFRRAVQFVPKSGDGVPYIPRGVVDCSLKIDVPDNYFTDYPSVIRQKSGLAFHGRDGVGLIFASNGLHYPLGDITLLDVFYNLPRFRRILTRT